MNIESVQELTGVELAYAFARAVKLEVFGSPYGPFAMLAKDERSMFIFGGNEETVKHLSFEGNFSEVPLQTAKELGAKLYVENGTATCRIGQQCAHGESFVQALMRAVILDDASKRQSSNARPQT